jgi:sugar-specific transcriptional regulator TrmB
MIEYKILEQLGLNEKEAIVYVACLRFPASGIAELAKHSGIQRTYLYDLTEKLIDKGFLTQTKKGDKKIFSAVDPRIILGVQREKLKNFHDIIQELESLSSKKNKRPEIVYYEGARELEKMMEGSVMHGGECLIFCDEMFYAKDNGQYQKKNIAQRLKNGTRCRVLAGLTNASLDSQKRDGREARETRMLPRDLFEPKVLVAAYRDKTLVANHAKNFGFVVEDEEFADTLKNIFELIWKSGRLVK